MSSQFGAPHLVVNSVQEISPQVLEQIAQWIENRGLKTSVSNIVGYQTDQNLTCIVQRVLTTQSIPNGFATDAVFDTAVFDPSKMWDGGSLIVVPVNGLYAVSAWSQMIVTPTNCNMYVSYDYGTVLTGGDYGLGSGFYATAVGTVTIRKDIGNTKVKLNLVNFSGSAKVTVSFLSVSLISRF